MDKISPEEFVKACCQFLIILSSCQFFGFLFEKIKLPKLTGEIFAGIIFGPNLFGYFLPETFHSIFNTKNNIFLSIFYWFGLIFLMQISGMEIEKKINKRHFVEVLALLTGATLIPILAGTYILKFYSFEGAAQNASEVAFNIIFICAMCVTSIPVISRIFLDLNILASPMAKMVLNVAVFQDSILWIALSIATSLVAMKEINTLNILTESVKGLAFFFILPSLLAKPLNKLFSLLKTKKQTHGSSWFFFAYCFVLIILADAFKINIIFAAFVAGVSLKSLEGDTITNFKKSISSVAFSLFIPCYFFKVGQNLNLVEQFHLAQVLEFFTFSSLVKIGGVFLFALILKFQKSEALDLGIALNTRGSPGIVLATVAFEANIINQSFFTTLVLASILTSSLTGIWFRLKLDNKIISEKWLIKDSI